MAQVNSAWRQSGRGVGRTTSKSSRPLVAGVFDRLMLIPAMFEEPAQVWVIDSLLLLVHSLPLHLHDFKIKLSLVQFRVLLKTHLFGWRSQCLVTYFTLYLLIYLLTWWPSHWRPSRGDWRWSCLFFCILKYVCRVVVKRSHSLFSSPDELLVPITTTQSQANSLWRPVNYSWAVSTQRNPAAYWLLYWVH